MSTQSKADAPGANGRESLPLFYKKPRPLDPRVHSKVSLKSDISLDFARAANAIPLAAVEFPAASGHYPIVFAADTTLAVVGLDPAQNLFIDEHGRWSAGCYVPAYVRRYPFIFLEANREQQTFALCIDETGDVLEPGQERPLFDADGKQTDVTQTALRFCAEYQRDQQATLAFVQALAALDLLIDRNANIALPSGRKINLAGFRVVDEARFNALPDTVFLEWRRQGWLGLVYAHLLSMGRWAKLGELAAAAT
ncbi:MAG: SapC family protein [Alphaproteobacteria bacterium]|nr:SapC family protein [Alphaproteobacteria bacterium]